MSTTYALALIREQDGRARYVRGIRQSDRAGSRKEAAGLTWQAEEAATWKTRAGAERAAASLSRPGLVVVEVAR